jgi:hypothetical protein
VLPSIFRQGYTCAAFQALPPELRSADDAALLRLARSSKWRRCPATGCGFMVEREHGCNYMVCRCGAKFCYACGVKYVSDKPSATNQHGTQGCRCALFEAPPDDDGNGAQVDPAAVAAAARERARAAEQGARERRVQRAVEEAREAQAVRAASVARVAEAMQAGRVRRFVPPVSRRPWRNGRCVSVTPCRLADSIHDCPRGRKCWFWHDEDQAAAFAGVDPELWDYWIHEGRDPFPDFSDPEDYECFFRLTE